MGPDAKDAIPPMVAMLKNTNKADDDSEIHLLTFALPDFGSIAVPELVSAMGETNPVIRERIICVLHNMGSEGKAALPALYDATRDGNSDVRTAAMLAIGRIGPDANAAVSMLLPLLKSEKPFTREFAARLLLDWVSSETPEAVPVLIDSLNNTSENDDQYSFREKLVDALGKIGPGSKAAIPVLINTFYHKKLDNLVPKAIQALTKIGPEAASELIKILNDNTSPIRGTAALALAEFGESSIPVLVTALKDEDSEVRGKAALALGRIGPGAKVAVPNLVEVLRSTVASINEEHNVRAAIALGDIGPNAGGAVPALIESLKDEGALRRFSVEALGKIGPAAVAAVPHLEALLKYSDDSWSRDEIKKALATIKRK
jgi:HEAT repeat protein